MYSFTTRPNIDGVLYKMLRHLGKTVSFDKLKDELDTHPDYPSLLAVSDVVAHFAIPNCAYRI